MQSLSEQSKSLKAKEEDALAKRDFWAEKAEKYRITLEVLQEESASEDTQPSFSDAWDMSYLKLGRDKKAHKRLKMFKDFVQRKGGQAHQEDFRTEMEKRGDDITASAWRTFLTRNAEKVNLIKEGEGVYATF